MPFIHLDEQGRAGLVGSRCRECGEIHTGERQACPACTARGTLEAMPLSLRGTLYNFSIVHRSFPGVATPFVTAIVDLEGGGTIKGKLEDVDPTIDALAFDMPVEVRFRVTEQTDKEGRPFVAHYFVPAKRTDR